MNTYFIEFVSDLRQLGGFLRVLRFPPPTNLTATICTRHKSLPYPLTPILWVVIKIKPEIVTGQYNSRVGISNVIFPGGRGK
jgi:hypothetical protein